MKILFFTHLYPPSRGGAEMLAARWAQDLAGRGHQVQVLTTDALSTGAFFLRDRRRVQPTRERLAGVEVERLPFRTLGARLLNVLRALACRFPVPGGSWLRTVSFGPRQPRFLARARQIDADLLVALPLPTYQVSYAVRHARETGKPLLVVPCFHLADPGGFDNPLFYRWLAGARRVVVFTEEERDWLAAQGVAEGNLEVIPPLPLLETVAAIQAAAPSREDARARLGIRQRRVILFIGQHGPHKKLQELFRACARLFARLPDTALVVAGGTTVLTPGFRRLGDEILADYRDRLYFFDDFAADLKPSLFRAADVFVFLSEHESFGIALTEAMAYGLPAVVSRSGVGRFQVGENREGVWVDPASADETASAMEELLTDPWLAEQLGRAARCKAVEYEPAPLLERWAAVVEEARGR